VIVRLYRIRSHCDLDGFVLDRGDWILRKCRFAGWDTVAVWKSNAERDLNLTAMGLQVPDNAICDWNTANPCMVEVEMEKLR